MDFYYLGFVIKCTNFTKAYCKRNFIEFFSAYRGIAVKTKSVFIKRILYIAIYRYFLSDSNTPFTPFTRIENVLDDWCSSNKVTFTVRSPRKKQRVAHTTDNIIGRFVTHAQSPIQDGLLGSYVRGQNIFKGFKPKKKLYVYIKKKKNVTT